LVDPLEHRQQRRVGDVLAGPVALHVGFGHGMAVARQVTQQFVVQAGGFQRRPQLLAAFRVVGEHLEHAGVLVAQQELDGAVLQRLEPRRRPQHFAEFHVVGRRQRLQHRPHLGELAEHRLAAGEDLLARPEFVALQVCDRGTELVHQQLQPQLRDLVLDDEQQLVVVRRVRQRFLRRQQPVQAQVAAVDDPPGQVGMAPRLERPLVALGTHVFSAHPGTFARMAVLPQPGPSMTVAAKFEIEYLQYLDADGKAVSELPKAFKDPKTLLPLFKQMLYVRTFDTKAIALQRTGKLGTYAACLGHEATHVGIGASMKPEDVFAPSYREYGAQFMRGVLPREVLMYWGGDERGNDFQGPKNDYPWCVPISTQCLMASGAALSFKLRKQDRIAVACCGDGGSSKTDFYAALNSAGAYKLPLVLCVI